MLFNHMKLLFKKSDLIFFLFAIITMFGLGYLIISSPSSPSHQPLAFQPPSYQKIIGFPGELECSNSFYTKESISAETFPKFLNYLAERYCLKSCKVCLINVYNNPDPFNVCMSPMTDDKECESLHIGHWDNFKNPRRWFKDSSGKKHNF